MHTVTVIVVHWNTPDILKQQIEHFKPSSHITYVVVDNNSKKRLTWLKKYRHIKLIQCNTNLGYAKACNLAANKFNTSDWILFLNPDTFISKSSIDDFIKKATRKKLDAASPKSTARYSKPIPSWWNLSTEFTPLKRLFKQQHPPQTHTKTTLFGGCLLIKRTIFVKINGWDESFFIWFEDSDLTKRLYDAGYKVGRVDVDHSHIGGATFSHLTDKTQKKLFFTSMRHYAQKHFNIWGRFVTLIISLRYE